MMDPIDNLFNGGYLREAAMMLALRETNVRLMNVVNHISTQSTGSELGPVGYDESTKQWMFLSGRGKTMLDAIEDDMKKASEK